MQQWRATKVPISMVLAVLVTGLSLHPPGARTADGGKNP